MLNNFFRERPKTATVKGEIPNTKQDKVSTTKMKLDLKDRSSSRLSSECMSPRDISSRGSVRSRPKSSLLNDRTVDYADYESDEDISVSDYDEADDEVDSRFGNSAQNYWSTLDDSIKRINDDSDRLSLKPRPNFKSSDIFKDVMTEMSGNTEYGVSKGYTLLKEKVSRLANVTSLTAFALSQASNKEEVDTKHDEDEEEEQVDEAKVQEEHEKDLKSAVGGAKRAWRVLKTHVHETAVEHRTTNVKMNWEAIRHHVSGITDLDKARIDLYQRYGFLPVVQEDGTKVCKNMMWLNRTRARLLQNPNELLLKGRLRAQSARPFTTQNGNRLRSYSGESMPNGHIRPVSCIPSRTNSTKLRPQSEKVTSKTRTRPTSVKLTSKKTSGMANE